MSQTKRFLQNVKDRKKVKYININYNQGSQGRHVILFAIVSRKYEVGKIRHEKVFSCFFFSFFVDFLNSFVLLFWQEEHVIRVTVS